MNNLINEHSSQEEENDLKKEIRYYLFFWPWFLASTAILLAVTFVKLRYENRVYESHSSVQIKKPDSDASSFLTGGVDGLLSFDMVNLDNDIAVITSQHILAQVVQRLNLQYSTYTFGSIVGSLRRTLIFDQQFPLTVELKNDINNYALDFEVKDGKLTVSQKGTKYTLLKGDELDLKNFVLRPEDSLFLKDVRFQIVRRTLDNAVAELRQSLTIEAVSRKAEVIRLSIKGTNKDRNNAILNTLIDVLAQDQVLDKRKISKVSMDFIDSRLEGLQSKIDTISKQTIRFQIDNGIYQPFTQSENALNKIVDDQKEIFGLGIQLDIANALLEKLEAQPDFDILPANIGIENESVNSLLNNYNITVAQRNTLLTSASENNPMVIQLNSRLKNAKAAINTGVNRYIEGLKMSLGSYQELESETRKRVAELPAKESTLRTYARNFTIAEELYVFLLKRKEEASISYISALPNLKILSYGVSSNSPISPNVQTSYLIAILLGLFVPFVILFVIKFFDTRINTREDLENGLPGSIILGEVPLDENHTTDRGNRGIVAESTRVIRSNMSFLLKEEKGQVIIVTSTVKGEGKSFISFNIAKSYASLGKKVLYIGADLRNPQVHTLLGVQRTNLGLSTLLNDVDNNDFDKLIVKGKSTEKMDYLLSGAIPPNPSELLMRPRFHEILERIKQNYDTIIFDTAPLLLVSDTLPLLPFADLVVYVTRSQYSDKKVFPFIKDLSSRENMPQFGIVLNGLVASASNNGYGYAYRYSYKYRYSYSYKYNYGYGYGYGRNEE